MASTLMQAFVVEGNEGFLRMVNIPKPAEGEALIKVLRAGVCNTDLEILRGYMGFSGVLGHEFVGVVEAVCDSAMPAARMNSRAAAAGAEAMEGAADGISASGRAAAVDSWVGQRVCGDINLACGGLSSRRHTSNANAGRCRNDDADGGGHDHDGDGGGHGGNAAFDSRTWSGQARACHACDSGVADLARNHCPRRSVLGILSKDGTYAQYLTLPLRNLHKVPDNVPDASAVFAEPLAAALRVVEQGLVSDKTKVAILGDGKLGLMICEVLGRQRLAERPALFGKHPNKMSLVGHLVRTWHVDECSSNQEFHQAFDVVVDATGSPKGMELSLSLLAPMGTLVLKSTCAQGAGFNNAPLVINENHVVGSRCGPIDEALRLLGSGQLNLDKYITAVYPLEQAQAALERAATKGCLKVHLVCK